MWTFLSVFSIVLLPGGFLVALLLIVVKKILTVNEKPSIIKEDCCNGACDGKCYRNDGSRRCK
jgi:hypothetical protein